jgi:hypothetical protein
MVHFYIGGITFSPELGGAADPFWEVAHMDRVRVPGLVVWPGEWAGM